MNEGTMVKIDLKHVVRDIDRHGNDRFYFRVKDQEKVRLPGIPGSEEFMETYQDALRKLTTKAGSLQRVSEGSFAWLCHIYFNSTTFKVELAPLSQATRRRILVNLHTAIGEKPFAKIEARHVRVWLDDRADRPEAANGLLKALRALFKFAVGRGIAKRNPVAEISKIKTKTDGHHTWTVSEVHRFENCHPLGSVARLAMALLLYTGSRRGDVVLLGRQHIREGWLEFRHGKTRAEVDLPILPQLQTVLDATNLGHMTFLVTSFGKPFTANGFGNAMRQWCDQAGLPHCSSHGLRKAGATIAAENGASDLQLMAIFGWTRAEMATLYTRRANRRKLSQDAMPLMVPRT
jgi:integrase